MSLDIKKRFVKVWKVEDTDYGKKFTLGTSRKDKEGNYINCNWFNCRFVGKSQDIGNGLQESDVIEIISGSLENVYKKDTKKTYFNLTVFEAKYEDDNKQSFPHTPTKKVAPAPVSFEDESDDEFPF